jgi:hypothetical protein
VPGAFLAHLVFAPSFPFVIVDPQFFPEDFAQDLNPKLGAEIAAEQRPTSLGLFGAPSGLAAWHALPSWYAVSGHDRAIDAVRRQPRRLRELFAHFLGGGGTEVAVVERVHLDLVVLGVLRGEPPARFSGCPPSGSSDCVRLVQNGGEDRLSSQLHPPEIRQDVNRGRACVSR